MGTRIRKPRLGTTSGKTSDRRGREFRYTRRTFLLPDGTVSKVYWACGLGRTFVEVGAVASTLTKLKSTVGKL
jgi:hypothetical protein